MRKLLLLFMAISAWSAGYAAPTVAWWLTKGDRSALIEFQKQSIAFGAPNSGPTLAVDTAQKYQTIDGIGLAVTSGAIHLLVKMNPFARAGLFMELFGSGYGSSIALSALQVPVDPDGDLLARYSMSGSGGFARQKTTTQPKSVAEENPAYAILKEVAEQMPNIKMIAAAEPPSLWMTPKGKNGTIRADYHVAYAGYVAHSLSLLGSANLPIAGIIPFYNQSLLGSALGRQLSAERQLAFVRDYLAPCLKKEHLASRIILTAGSSDSTTIAAGLLGHSLAYSAVVGMSFQEYTSKANPMAAFRNKYPNKKIYATGAMPPSKGTFGIDLVSYTKNVLMANLNSGSCMVLVGELANGTSTSQANKALVVSQNRAAITISGSSVQQNAAYYAIAHLSKFVPQGSVRVASESKGKLHSIAFVTPDKRTVLVVANEAATPAAFNIRCANGTAPCILPANSIATYQW
jgi:glucosylceramidase